MLLSQKYEDGILSTFYVDSLGNLKRKNISITPYKWIELDQPDRRSSKKFTSWNSKSVRKIKSKSLDKYVKMEILWRLPEKQQEDIFAICSPEQAFVDIEVDFAKEFPRPEEVKYGITTISTAWLDKKTNKIKVILQTLKKLDTSEKSYVTKSITKHFANFDYEFDVKYLFHESEEDLLITFIEKITKKFLILTGWNFINFDWHYIYNRMKKIGLNMEEFYDKDVYISNSRGCKGVAFPCSKGIVDLMEIFGKFDRSIEVKESMSLDFISGQILGVDKVVVNESLDLLYSNNFKEYCFYNIVDSILCLLIEEKRQVLKLYYTLSCISYCDIGSTVKPTRSTETVLSKKFYENNKVLPSPPWDNETVKEHYEGAYVMEPISGVYEWMMSKDFASLYPTSARMGRLSPESFIGNYYDEFINSGELLSDSKEDYLNYVKDRRYIDFNLEGLTVDDKGNIYFKKVRGIYKGQNELLGNWFSEYISNKSENIRSEYFEYLQKEKYIPKERSITDYYIDPKGTLFDVQMKSVYPQILEQFSEDRQKHKKLMKSFYSEKEKLEKILMNKKQEIIEKETN